MFAYWLTDVIYASKRKKKKKKSEKKKKKKHGWLGRAMVLGSFQYRVVLLLWHMVGQAPAVLAAGT